MIHYDIQKISANYKKQGKEAVNKVRTVFEAYHIPLQQSTPTSLFFIPQPALPLFCRRSAAKLASADWVYDPKAYGKLSQATSRLVMSTWGLY